MRLVIGRASLRRILLCTQRALFGVAFLFLGYWAFVLMDAWIFQKAEDRQFERLQAEQRKTRDSARPVTSAASAQHSQPVSPDGLIGRIEVPRLGVSAMIIEGIRTKALRRAVGHIPGTAMPGQSGNIGIAGHRDTFFRPLRSIRQDDIITLTTPFGAYRYRVVSTRIVGPHEVTVLSPTTNEVLTLVTCYPFYLVGPAPDRFIVRAERIA